LTGQIVQTTAELPIRIREGTSDTVMMSPSPERSQEILSPKMPDSWVSIIEEEGKLSPEKVNYSTDVDMEMEGLPTRTAIKRKKTRNPETDSVEEDSASDAAKNPRRSIRPRRKRTPLSAADK